MKFSYTKFYLIWLISLIFLSMTAVITFGHGLGDLYDLINLVILSTVLFVFYFIIFKIFKNKSSKILNLLKIIYYLYITFIIILFSLKLTLFRGSEYSWNGNIFFKVPFN